MIDSCLFFLPRFGGGLWVRAECAGAVRFDLRNGELCLSYARDALFFVLEFVHAACGRYYFYTRTPISVIETGLRKHES